MPSSRFVLRLLPSGVDYWLDRCRRHRLPLLPHFPLTKPVEGLGAEISCALWNELARLAQPDEPVLLSRGSVPPFARSRKPELRLRLITVKMR
jgi:hypothetical protein